MTVLLWYIVPLIGGITCFLGIIGIFLMGKVLVSQWRSDSIKLPDTRKANVAGIASPIVPVADLAERVTEQQLHIVPSQAEAHDGRRRDDAVLRADILREVMRQLGHGFIDSLPVKNGEDAVERLARTLFPLYGPPPLELVARLRVASSEYSRVGKSSSIQISSTLQELLDHYEEVAPKLGVFLRMGQPSENLPAPVSFPSSTVVGKMLGGAFVSDPGSNMQELHKLQGRTLPLEKIKVLAR